MRFVILLVCLSMAITVPATSQTVDDETAARLAEEFQLPEVIEIFRLEDDLDLLEDPLYQLQAHKGDGFSFNIGYKELDLPGNKRCYVVLYWSTRFGTLYWVLLGSDDGTNFDVLQKPDSLYNVGGMSRGRPWIATADLDGDEIPEVLLQSGNCRSRAEGLYVHRWLNGHLDLISPTTMSPNRPLPMQETDIVSINNNVSLQDFDEDGVYEIVAHPNLGNDIIGELPDGTPEIALVMTSGAQVFCMQDGVYVLCDSYPLGEEPRVVRGIAAIHPGTIPLAELEAPGKGQLRLFVGTPAGDRLTADDFDPESFVHRLSGTELELKKRWANAKNPDLSFTTMYWKGIPYRASERSSQGAWQVNPASPAVPGLSDDEVLTFVGPYLELRMPLAAAAERLRGQAVRFFEEHPDQDRAWVTLSIAARMNDGTRAAVVAVGCVSTTGGGSG